jgi:hypothetical protein
VIFTRSEGLLGAESDFDECRANALPPVKSPASYGVDVVVTVEVTVGSLYVQLVTVTVWV